VRELWLVDSDYGAAWSRMALASYSHGSFLDPAVMTS